MRLMRQPARMRRGRRRDSRRRSHSRRTQYYIFFRRRRVDVCRKAWCDQSGYLARARDEPWNYIASGTMLAYSSMGSRLPKGVDSPCDLCDAARETKRGKMKRQVPKLTIVAVSRHEGGTRGRREREFERRLNHRRPPRSYFSHLSLRIPSL